MKTFSFILPLILCILCLLYLLFYPCQDTNSEHVFSAKVLAKENDNNTISNALFLAADAACKDKLEAHEKCYYYVSTQRNITFSINSPGIQYIKADLLSDTGKHIPYQIQKKKNTLLLTPVAQKVNNMERIFLCLINQSASGCTVQIQSITIITATPKPDKSTASNQKTATPKPDKSTASSQKTAAPKPDKSTASSQKTATPKPDKSAVSNQISSTTKSDKTLVANVKEAALQPQFLLLPPDSSKAIKIANYSQKNAAKQFIWISTNPNTATVKNGIIKTHKEGTAIIYLKNKKNVNNTSSCVIRVIGKETIIEQ